MSSDAVEKFELWLLAQGLAPRTAQRHARLIRLFIQGYLKEWEFIEPDEADGEAILFFLEHWCPVHLGEPSPARLGYHSAFRRFYTFLYQEGKISRAALDEILWSLEWRSVAAEASGESPDHLMTAEDYAMKTDPLELSASERQALRSGISLDRQLLLLLNNITRPEAPLILDFTLFLERLAQQPIKLTPKTVALPGKTVYQLNQMFSRPERLPAKAGQESSIRVHLFYHLSQALSLLEVTSRNVLRAGRLLESFLALQEAEKAALLIDGLWNVVTWTDLVRSSEPEFLHWAQTQRGGFAELLSELTPGRPWSTLAVFGGSRREEVLANYIVIYEPVVSRVLFALSELSILSYVARSGEDLYGRRRHPNIESLTITRFGRQVMKYLARKARREAKGRSLVQRMEEELTFM